MLFYTTSSTELTVLALLNLSKIIYLAGTISKAPNNMTNPHISDCT